MTQNETSLAPCAEAGRADRRQMLLGLLGTAALLGGLSAPLVAKAAAPAVEVYKDPSCGCCGNWAEHLRQNGFAVTVHEVVDMAAIKRQAGIPEPMESCHTAVVDGYLIEGHVPAADIRRLLAERPGVRGLAVPGMPASAPGMDMPGEPYIVFSFYADGDSAVFASH